MQVTDPFCGCSMLEKEFEQSVSNSQQEIVSTLTILDGVTKSRAAKFFFQLCGATAWHLCEICYHTAVDILVAIDRDLTVACSACDCASCSFVKYNFLYVQPVSEIILELARSVRAA